MHTIDGGLGLTLACKSAILMNGNIALVSSTLGCGSHFKATFSEPICASSFPRSHSSKERLIQLPTSFHRSPSLAPGSTLWHHIKGYLVHQGYIESEKPEGSFLILEYTPNLARLYRHISEIKTGQVAICLLPESASFVDFDGEQVKRQDNVIYIRSPILSITLDTALEVAVSILVDFRASVLDSRVCPSSGGSLSPHINPSTTTIDDPSDLSLYRGSIFPQVVRMELAQSVEHPQIESSSSNTLRDPTTSSKKPMTLLVDDNTVNLRLLEMYCKRRGIPYRTATDGQEAVQIFTKFCLCSNGVCNAFVDGEMHSQPFDLILMDLQMPICDGIEATRQIRALEKNLGCDKTLLFIVTGQDSPSDRTNAAEAGSDGYLVKPVGPKVFDKWVKQWFPDIKL